MYNIQCIIYSVYYTYCIILISIYDCQSKVEFNQSSRIKKVLKISQCRLRIVNDLPMILLVC